MVLEEATQSSDSVNDDSFPSDPDPFSSSDNGPSLRSPAAFTIDMNSLPKAMPILGPLTGHTSGIMLKGTENFVNSFSRMAQRPLTQDEANVLAFYGAKMRSTASWGDGLGVVLGAVRCYQTAGIWKLPLRKPPNMETFNPDKFWRLRGPLARLSHHSVRFAAYALVGNLAVGFLAMNYALSVAALSVRTDPRLKALNESMNQARKHRDDEKRNAQGLPGVEGMPGVGRMPTRPQQNDSGWRTDEDDMSPTAGSANSDYAWESRTSESPSGLSRAGRGEERVNPQHRQGYQQPYQSQSSTESYDSDSPTGGHGPLEPTSNQSSSGSAWDRIRKQATSGEGPSQGSSRQGQQRPSGKSSSSDPFDM